MNCYMAIDLDCLLQHLFRISTLNANSIQIIMILPPIEFLNHWMKIIIMQPSNEKWMYTLMSSWWNYIIVEIQLVKIKRCWHGMRNMLHKFILDVRIWCLHECLTTKYVFLRNECNS